MIAGLDASTWGTEGPLEMLSHYNIAAVMTDSPQKENLQFLSEIIVTASHSLIRFHGRNTRGHYWYNYLYSEEELRPWVEKVGQIKKQTKTLRIYFNNHYGGKAVVNAMQFKQMNGIVLSADEKQHLENPRKPQVSLDTVFLFQEPVKQIENLLRDLH